MADTSLSQSQSDEGQNSADEGQGQDSESFDAKTYAQIWRGRDTGVTRKCLMTQYLPLSFYKSMISWIT